MALKQLEELDLSHNYMSEIPEAVFHFPNLKIIALINNPWNEKTWAMIPRKAEELKLKEIFVHVSERE